MSELALQLIAEAKRTNAKKLDLGMCGLNELPEVLFELIQLEELYLCNRYYNYDTRAWIDSKNNGKPNHISTIPSKIKQLNGLIVLKCGGDFKHGSWNMFDITALKELKQLKSLHLRSNYISDVSFLKDLRQLQSLHLRSNNISDISFLKEL